MFKNLRNFLSRLKLAIKILKDESVIYKVTFYVKSNGNWILDKEFFEMPNQKATIASCYIVWRGDEPCQKLEVK